MYDSLNAFMAVAQLEFAVADFADFCYFCMLTSMG